MRERAVRDGAKFKKFGGESFLWARILRKTQRGRAPGLPRAGKRNSTPAFSTVSRRRAIASSGSVGGPLISSRRRIVEAEVFAASARSRTDQFRIPRAARSCAPVIVNAWFGEDQTF